MKAARKPTAAEIRTMDQRRDAERLATRLYNQALAGANDRGLSAELKAGRWRLAAQAQRDLATLYYKVGANDNGAYHDRKARAFDREEASYRKKS